MHFTEILIIIALTKNNGCTISTDGEFLFQKVKFEVLFTWQLTFYSKQNNFRVFEKLIFFDLWIPVSGFWIPVFGSRFWILVSGF